MQGVETTSSGEAVNGDATSSAEQGTTADTDGRVAGKKAVSDWEVQKRVAENRRRFVGDGGVNIWRKGLEIGNPFEEGICE